ncbi:MAG: ABC transporter ATP-binding protein [Spirochaetota bacterium]
MLITQARDVSSPLLEAEAVTKRFGGIVALRHYTLRLQTGELLGLIGPNGAGKTTAFNLISGVIKPTSGTIRFSGADITHERPDRNAFHGITRTFQNIRLFEQLSVFDNIRIALHMRHGSGLVGTLLYLPRFVRSERTIAKQAEQIMHILDIWRFRDTLAGNLAYGDQRRVEIARALAAEPKLLLLDEPAAGLNPSETEEMMKLISKIYEEYKLTLMLVEHDMKVIMRMCKRIQVLDQGLVIAEGPPEAIKSNPRVIEAYLGKSN